MLYDYACTPQIFSNEALEINSAHFTLLTMFLRGVLDNGMIADLNNGDWKKNVIQNINHLPPKYKDKIAHLYQSLKDKNLIVGHKKSDLKPSNEEEWLKLAELSNEKEPFYGIISLLESDLSHSLEDMLESDKWIQRSRTHYVVQNEENLRKELKPVLSYARKVTLIDPYFSTLRSKYRTTLGIIAELLRSQRGNVQKGMIEIHIRYKAGETDASTFLNSWMRSSQEIFQKHGHICKMFQWDKAESWHDRYIITDQCGIHVGAGLDDRNEGKSTWSKLDYSTLSDIVKDFRENSSPYILKSQN